FVLLRHLFRASPPPLLPPPQIRARTHDTREREKGSGGRGIGGEREGERVKRKSSVDTPSNRIESCRTPSRPPISESGTE
uniref:Uncharacterized protein n=1 Tax=Oryza brachyantha TaxID=4533 RepID=J3LJE3_ORYBR